MAKNEDVPPSPREITDCASFRDNCCATAERKLFVDLDETVAQNPGTKKKSEKILEKKLSLLLLERKLSLLRFATRKKKGGEKVVNRFFSA